MRSTFFFWSPINQIIESIRFFWFSSSVANFAFSSGPLGSRISIGWRLLTIKETELIEEISIE